MIAEIYGKLSSTGSNLNDRLEDQLTGNVFGACRYLSPERLLWPLMRSAYTIGPNGRQEILLNEPRLISTPQFWPWLKCAEPDALLLASEVSGKNIALAIECKLDSGLSGEDQLLREMLGLAATYPYYRQVLIYLTEDISYPHKTMQWTREEADKGGLTSTELYWLSWHDMPQVVESAKKELPTSRPEWYVLDDLERLLARKGFARFSSVHLPEPSSLHLFTFLFSPAILENAADICYRMQFGHKPPLSPHPVLEDEL